MPLIGVPSIKQVAQGYIIRANFNWLAGVTGPALNLPALFSMRLKLNLGKIETSNASDGYC